MLPSNLIPAKQRENLTNLISRGPKLWKFVRAHRGDALQLLRMRSLSEPFLFGIILRC